MPAACGVSDSDQQWVGTSAHTDSVLWCGSCPDAPATQLPDAAGYGEGPCSARAEGHFLVTENSVLTGGGCTGSVEGLPALLV